MKEGTNHEFRYRGITAGASLRLHKTLKAGAFYRTQQGSATTMTGPSRLSTSGNG